ncbi:hypothetical protein NESM_000565700 [Novymonas esmeraldas]|uniref:Uncharacterized protein n=1 Tax=Novymonas esmeraldas TaxID=1808958 RepID=A0AAW0ES13_9TRYP
MLCYTRRALLQRSRAVLEQKFESHSAGVDPTAQTTVTGKLKTEIKKMIKIQLFLIPIGVFFMMWMYPAPTEEQERKMRIEYEQNAGWKT